MLRGIQLINKGKPACFFFCPAGPALRTTQAKPCQVEGREPSGSSSIPGSLRLGRGAETPAHARGAEQAMPPGPTPDRGRARILTRIAHRAHLFEERALKRPFHS